jgi:hypothetical protein
MIPIIKDGRHYFGYLSGAGVFCALSVSSSSCARWESRLSDSISEAVKRRTAGEESALRVGELVDGFSDSTRLENIKFSP